MTVGSRWVGERGQLLVLCAVQGSELRDESLHSFGHAVVPGEGGAFWWRQSQPGSEATDQLLCGESLNVG